ncbi:MAG: O-antigen ligase family protein [bacterium]|nr:O-antigen ligase family protein [bacterium]
MIASFLFGVGLVLLISNDIMISRENHWKSLTHRLIPLTLLLLITLISLIVSIAYTNKAGMICFLAITSTVVIVYILASTKHLLFLAVTSMILAISPFVSFAKSPWIYNMWWFLLLILFVHRAKYDEHKIDYPSMKIFLIFGFLYFLWACFSFLFSPVQDSKTVFKIFGVASQLLFIVLLVGNTKTMNDVLALATGFLVGFLIIATLMLKSMLEMMSSLNAILLMAIGFRASVGEISPNIITVPILITFIIALSFAKKSSGYMKYIFILITLSALFLIVSSGSRAMILVVLLVTPYLMSFTKKAYRNTLFVLAGFALLVFTFYTLNQSIAESLLRLNSIASGSGRILIWENSLELIRSSPIIGTGPNSSMILLQQEVNQFSSGSTRWTGGRAHNVFINEAIDTGLVGVTLFLLFHIGLFVWISRMVPDKKSPWRVAAFGVLAGFLIRGFFEANDLLLSPDKLKTAYAPIVSIVLAVGYRIQVSRSEDRSRSNFRKENVS